MFGFVNVEFIGLGFLFGLSVWAAVYAVRACVRSAFVVSDLVE